MIDSVTRRVLSRTVDEVRTLDGAAAEMKLDLEMLGEMKADTIRKLQEVRRIVASKKTAERRNLISRLHHWLKRL